MQNMDLDGYWIGAFSVHDITRTNLTTRWLNVSPLFLEEISPDGYLPLKE